MKVYNKNKLYTSDKILVTGYCGSGKSTYGKELARQLKLQYVSLDEFETPFMDSLLKNNTRQEIDAWTDEEYYTKLVEEAIIKYDNGVFEGISILYSRPKQFKKYPIVLLDTNILKSTSRAIARDIEKRTEIRLGYIKLNYNLSKHIKKFKETLGGNKVWQ